MSYKVWYHCHTNIVSVHVYFNPIKMGGDIHSTKVIKGHTNATFSVALKWSYNFNILYIPFPRISTTFTGSTI